MGSTSASSRRSSAWVRARVLAVLAVLLAGSLSSCGDDDPGSAPSALGTLAELDDGGSPDAADPATGSTGTGSTAVDPASEPGDDPVVEMTATGLSDIEGTAGSMPRFDEDPVLAPPTTGPEPAGALGPEPAFSGNEAAALTCAHLERALRALERSELDEIRSALSEAADLAQASESSLLSDAAHDWTDVADIAVAERIVWASLDVCIELDYSL